MGASKDPTIIDVIFALYKAGRPAVEIEEAIEAVPSGEVRDTLRVVLRLMSLEDDAIENLERTFKAHPLAPFVKRTSGLGAKQVARLLCCIGDPYWHSQQERPRTVSELWAYCGYRVDNGIAQKRVRGQQANWNSKAKMRAFLIAESCMKARTSPYRKVYDDAREHYRDAVHAQPCPQCGTKRVAGQANKPAEVGSPLNLKHQHHRALRKVAKEVLKDLWAESKRLHEKAGDLPVGEVTSESKPRPARPRRTLKSAVEAIAQPEPKLATPRRLNGTVVPVNGNGDDVAARRSAAGKKAAATRAANKAARSA